MLKTEYLDSISDTETSRMSYTCLCKTPERPCSSHNCEKPHGQHCVDCGRGCCSEHLYSDFPTHYRKCKECHDRDQAANRAAAEAESSDDDT